MCIYSSISYANKKGPQWKINIQYRYIYPPEHPHTSKINEEYDCANKDGRIKDSNSKMPMRRQREYGIKINKLKSKEIGNIKIKTKEKEKG